MSKEFSNGIERGSGEALPIGGWPDTDVQRLSDSKHSPGKQPRLRERYYVPVGNGESQEVTREVYLCIYSSKRHEKYLGEQDREHGTVSLDARAKVEGEPTTYGCVIPSPLDLEEMVIRSALTQELRRALQRLSPEEWLLIDSLFFQNIGIREYARQKGVTHHAVQKSRDKILAALRRELEGVEEE